MAKVLTDRQQLFIEEYLICWNASKAARRAGYAKKSADVEGARLLVNDGIREKIKARLAERAMEADEVLARLATMARADISPFLTESGLIDMTTDSARNSLYLVRKIKVKSHRIPGSKKGEEEIETEIELHDPKDALVQIGKHLALFTDKKELTITWREKAKEKGYDPDSILQQVATAIAERDFGRGDSGGSGENTAEEQPDTV